MQTRPTAFVLALTVLLTITGVAGAQCVEDCEVIHTFVGESAGDQFGWVSNDLGDLTGDGIHDLILTAPTNDAGGANAGRCYVYDGASGELLYMVTGAAANYWFGHDANTAGTIDDDDVPDFIVGAPNNGTGRAIVYSGVDGSAIQQIPGQAVGDEFGYRVHGGGDFDGDGVTDLLVGAPGHDSGGTNSGRAYVFTSDGFTTICTIDGPTSFDRFGSGVTFIGDVNGDGRDDIAVGSMNAGSGGGLGFVYGWNGESCEQLYTLNPGSPSTNFGQWFMNGGDVNGDGTPDVYINDFPVNRAHVFSGVDGTKLWTFTGDGSGGFGIGRIGSDVNGDGAADLILAAWVSGAGAPQAGKAFVYSGKDASLLETFTHDIAGAGFGFDANGMGDVNQDGKEDYLITAALDNANANRGIAYLIAGTIGPPPVPGDLDGDGDVDGADLGLLLGSWGPCEGCPADLDGDDEVDGADLGLLLGNWK